MILQLNEGTADFPFVLTDAELTNIYRIATNSIEAEQSDIRGYYTTTSGTISSYQAYMIRKAWPNINILAREVATSDWGMAWPNGSTTITITEGGRTEINTIGIALEVLTVTIGDITVNADPGSTYTEQQVREHLHIDKTTGLVTFDAPTSNAGWQANVVLKFLPSYVTSPTPSDYRTLNLNIRAIAISDIVLTAPSTAGTETEVAITARAYPSNHTKLEGITYDFKTTSGTISGSRTTGDATLYTPSESSTSCLVTVNYYLFGSTISAGYKTATINIRDVQLTLSASKSLLMEGETCVITPSGYTRGEIQTRVVFQSSSGIEESDLMARLTLNDSGTLALKAATDNKTFTGNVRVEAVPIGIPWESSKRASVTISLRAIGITSLNLSTYSLGQYFDNKLVMSVAPANHTKSAVTFRASAQTSGTMAITGSYPNFTVFSEQLGADNIVLDAVFAGKTQFSQVRTLTFRTTSFTLTPSSQNVKEGDSINVECDNYTLAELQNKIEIKMLDGSDASITPEMVKSRVHVNADNTISFEQPRENKSWRATVQIEFVPMYADFDNPPSFATFSIQLDAVAVTGCEWHNVNVDEPALERFAALGQNTMFRIDALPRNNTKMSGVTYERSTTSGASVFGSTTVGSGGVFTFLTNDTYNASHILRGAVLVFDDKFDCEDWDVVTYNAGSSRRAAYGRWTDWEDTDPDAVDLVGVNLTTDAAREWLLDWHPYLFDMDPVEGETAKVPVGQLKDNCIIRFTDGRYAPVVVISVAQRDECMANDLYLDDRAVNKYCSAGEFDPAAFYENKPWGTALYTADGVKVRVLRPWETTETKYSVLIARRDGVHLIDNEVGGDGYVMKGIALDGLNVNGSTRHADFKLERTAFCPHPATMITGNKLRCAMFDFAENTTCRGTPGIGDHIRDFYDNGLYPRCSLSAQGYMEYARRNNFVPDSPLPVAEGGYHTLNTFVTCCEAAYGTKYLHRGTFLGVGWNVQTCNSEESWQQNGGVKVRNKNSETYSYYSSNGQISIMRYTATAGASYSHAWLCDKSGAWGPFTRTLEPLVCISVLIDQGKQPGEQLEVYGKVWDYATPNGIDTVINSGRMTCRAYMNVHKDIHAFDASGNEADFDFNVRVEYPLLLGFYMTGEIGAYCQGGLEMVQRTDNGSVTEQPTAIYLQPDQSKWWKLTSTVNGNGVVWPFEEDQPNAYLRVDDGTVKSGSSSYLKRRCAYSPLKQVGGGGSSTGECAYNWQTRFSTTVGYKTRVGCVSRLHNASAGSGSARFLFALNAVGVADTYWGGSFQIRVAE